MGGRSQLKKANGENFRIKMSKRSLNDEYDPDDASKRSRREAGSRVVFVRGIPSDCQENELLALCCPFAVVEKTLLIPTKGQAFVQLPDIASATNLVEFYKARDTVIRDNQLKFEFSNREEITKRSEMESRPSSNSGNGSTGERRRGGRPGNPNSIMLVCVSDIQYDMTIEVLHQVFSKFGKVIKVVIFGTDDDYKALVQMNSIDEAGDALNALDGRDIYTGCNKLHIVFSKHNELRVRCNNDRSRDFTNPNLPSEEGEQRSSGMLGDGPPRASRDHPPRQSDYHHSSPRHDYRGGPPPPDYRGGYPEDFYRHGGGGRYDAPPRGGPDPRYDGRGGYDAGYGPPPPRYDDRYGNPPPPRRFDDDPRGTPRVGGYPGYDRYPGPPPAFDDRHPGYDMGPPPPRGREPPGRMDPSPVIICSKIDAKLVSPESLFKFFGCFGNVIRIKVLFKKQDTALIQFSDPMHAVGVREMLNGVQIFGGKLRVDHSRHFNIGMPRNESAGVEREYTQDYTNSPLHRYRGGKNTKNIVPPCPGLHVSGIGPDIQGDTQFFEKLFSEHGKVVKVTFFERDTRMAMVDMETLDDAVAALIALDNLETHGHHLRVSFSKAYLRKNNSRH